MDEYDILCELDTDIKECIGVSNEPQLTVCSTAISGLQQRNFKAPHHWLFVSEIDKVPSQRDSWMENLSILSLNRDYQNRSQNLQVLNITVLDVTFSHRNFTMANDET